MDPDEPEPIVAPATTSLLQAVFALQRMERGMPLGLREKRPIVRRARSSIRWYCSHGPVMAVVAIFQILGGAMSDETTMEIMREFIGEEIASLAAVAFGFNQEALANFLTLFPR